MKSDYEAVSIALLSTPTIAAAVKKCGLTERHIHRLKRYEEFCKVLYQKRNDLFSLVNDRAIAYREKAFSILCEIAEDYDESTGNRLGALKQIFAVGDFAKSEELEERLQKLEELNENEHT